MISELPAQGLDQTRRNHYSSESELVQDNLVHVPGGSVNAAVKKIFGFRPVILAVSDPV